MVNKIKKFWRLATLTLNRTFSLRCWANVSSAQTPELQILLKSHPSVHLVKKTNEKKMAKKIGIAMV